MLGVGMDGVRSPRPLEDWRAWLSCFDVVQLNEEELGTLASGWEDPWALAADVVGPVTRGLLVTLGERGAAWVATRSFWKAPTELRSPPGAVAPAEALVSGKVEPEVPVSGGDPTGCGGVWGATCFAPRRSGENLESSVRAATRAAQRNAGFRGASGLGEYLRSETGVLTRGAGSQVRGSA
ncbi:MAG: carbohydrate kinase family protein [Gemmatimonadales bacterium]|nr:carbohydrate kinase family protein [Gemmatimonadales bacterium]